MLKVWHFNVDISLFDPPTLITDDFDQRFVIFWRLWNVIEEEEEEDVLSSEERHFEVKKDVCKEPEDYEWPTPTTPTMTAPTKKFDPTRKDSLEEGSPQTEWRDIGIWK